jgi:predicted dehydrogenase
MTKLGAAVVGLGIGTHHALAFARAGCSVRWLCDLDLERATSLRPALKEARTTRRFEDILDDPATQIVSIASYDDVHAAQVVAALRAGKHVFVEKPMCRSGRELASIRSAWKRAGTLHLQSNLVLRTAPLYRWLRSKIESGLLGDLYAIDGDYLYGRLNKITEGWRGRIRDYSVMAGGGIHMIDLMLWFAGEQPRQVQATGNRIATAGTRFRASDFMAATYRFPSGLLGRITANFGCVHRHQHVVRVFGTRGTFLMDDAGARLFTRRGDKETPRRIAANPLPPSKGALIPGFVRAIRRHEDPGPAARREFSLMDACLSADRALTLEKEIELG